MSIPLVIRELSFFTSRGGWWKRGGSSQNNWLKRGDQEKIIVIKGGIKQFCSTASNKIEWVRVMLPLELLCISPELTRVTCLVTST